MHECISMKSHSDHKLHDIRQAMPDLPTLMILVAHFIGLNNHSSHRYKLTEKHKKVKVGTILQHKTCMQLNVHAAHCFLKSVVRV